MATITEQLITKLSNILSNKNSIRDLLASEKWDKRVGTSANLQTVQEALYQIPTFNQAKIIDIGPETEQGSTYTIPKGYHTGNITINWKDDTNQEGIDYKLYPQGDVTPKGADQEIKLPSGYYGLTPFTVKAIPHPYYDVSSLNVTDLDVLPGKRFIDKNGVTQYGNMPTVSYDAQRPDGNHHKLSPLVSEHIVKTGHYIYADAGYKISVNTEEITRTPTDEKQEILASTSNRYFSKVTINPIPEEYVYYEELSKIIDQI
mgnify:CR=1 FL=1